MPLPRARDPQEAGLARHPPAAEGRGVSCGRTARRDPPREHRPPLRTPIQPEPIPSPPPPPRPARPAAPGRMRKTRQRGDGGRGDARPAAGPDPGRPSPTPARAPGRPRQLLTSSPGGCARPPLAQISAARTPRGGTQGPQPRTPSPPACSRPSRSPLGMLPCEPPYYGATKLRALPAPVQSSRPPMLLCSLAPAYLLISLRRLPPHTPPTCQPSAPPTDGRG